MNTVAFVSIPNGPEIIVIFRILFVNLGGKRLPELLKSLGKSIREFKKATTEIEEDIRTAMDEEPKKPSANTADSEQPPMQIEAEGEVEAESVDAPSEEKNTDKA
ncbi:MAG: twin-arginine translocase TatA/TatE family subunit [Verrucomicrobiota bacterium]|nr:twin-arginine translocase TatA/TatE family subunit [Verrucomicrobiota bacterium]